MNTRLTRPFAAAAALVAGCTFSMLAGCAGNAPPAPPAPAANSTTPAGATNEGAAAPAKATATMAGCPDKDATHVLVGDAPVFTGPPGQGALPAGMLKSGSKVLAMIPGKEYTQCTIADGKSVYVKTSMLKPTTN